MTKVASTSYLTMSKSDLIKNVRALNNERAVSTLKDQDNITFVPKSLTLLTDFGPVDSAKTNKSFFSSAISKIRSLF
jgi:hypothetical protein